MTDLHDPGPPPPGWPTIDDPLPEPEHIEEWAARLGLLTMISHYLVPPREIDARRGESTDEAWSRYFVRVAAQRGESPDPDLVSVIPDETHPMPTRYIGRGYWISYRRTNDGVAYAAMLLQSPHETFAEQDAHDEQEAARHADEREWHDDDDEPTR